MIWMCERAIFNMLKTLASLQSELKGMWFFQVHLGSECYWMWICSYVNWIAGMWDLFEMCASHKMTEFLPIKFKSLKKIIGWLISIYFARFHLFQVYSNWYFENDCLLVSHSCLTHSSLSWEFCYNHTFLFAFECVVQ